MATNYAIRKRPHSTARTSESVAATDRTTSSGSSSSVIQEIWDSRLRTRCAASVERALPLSSSSTITPTHRIASHRDRLKSLPPLSESRHSAAGLTDSPAPAAANHWTRSKSSPSYVAVPLLSNDQPNRSGSISTSYNRDDNTHDNSSYLSRRGDGDSEDHTSTSCDTKNARDNNNGERNGNTTTRDGGAPASQLLDGRSLSRCNSVSGQRSTLAGVVTEVAVGSRAESTRHGTRCAVSSLRSHSRLADAARERSLSPPQPSPLAKPLFRNTLLQEIGPRDLPPLLTVVLDLDETLVSNRSGRYRRSTLRPYCLHVLNAMRHFKNIEIILWTASTKETATPVVRQLHAVDEVLDDVIFRNNLWFTEPTHTKDLRLLGRDIDHVVIVENSANSCKLNPRHAILVDDFHGDRRESDAALVNVYYMIEALVKYRKDGLTVPEGLQLLAKEGDLCYTMTVPMQESAKFMLCMGVSPLKLPAHGVFIRSKTLPPQEAIMQHWTI